MGRAPETTLALERATISILRDDHPTRNAERIASAAPPAGWCAGSPLRRLDPRRRRALELFRRSVVITSRDVEALFGVSQRTARNIPSSWMSGGFVLVVDPARKSRSDRLSPEYEGLGPS